MPLTMNPALNQQMAQLEREYEQRKANIMQSFYNQPQGGVWGQQSAPIPTQNVDWIRVSGIDGAKNQIVQPGQTVWMMDNNEPYFYVKSADNVGSCTVRIFQFAEVQEVAQEQPEKPQIDLSQYVQRSEFEQLKVMIEQITNAQEKQPVKANKEVVSNGESVNGNDGKQTGTGRTSGARGK